MKEFREQWSCGQRIPSLLIVAAVLIFAGCGLGNCAPGLTKVAGIDYVGDGNPRQSLDLYLPKVETKGLRPVLLWIHGGAWQKGSKDRPGRALKFADLGCAVISINYLLTQERIWPAQIHDCKAAIRWVKANAPRYRLDPKRIVLWGASAGGHLVTFLGATQSDPAFEGKLGPHPEQSTTVKAVINFFGPTDFLLMDQQGSVMDHNEADSPEGLLLGGEVSSLKDKARAASPFHQVGKDDAPILTVHGTKDPLVPYQQGKALDQKYDGINVPSILLTVKGGGHGKGFGPSVDREVRQFLKRHFFDEEVELKDRSVEASQ